QSEHPLAEAIVEGVLERGITLSAVSGFQALPGLGIEAQADNTEVAVGTRKLMQDQQISIDEAVEQQLISLEQQGKTAMLVAINKQFAAIIAVADTVKETSAEAVKRLHALGLNVIMLTGDNERTAKAIAAEVGIDEVIAEVLPEQKAQQIEKLKQQGRNVAMVGDGI